MGVEPLSVSSEFRTIRRGHDVTEGINIHDAGLWIRRPDGLDSFNRTSNESPLQFHTFAEAVRSETTDMSARPGEEGRLVDGCKVAGAMGARANVLCGGVAIVGKPF